MDSQTRPAEEGRCPWCGSDPLYVAYHDTEWGVPERDPRDLWEKLVLDGFQAGLAWITILRKRDGIRDAGGIPLEVPIHPIQETGKRPTAALDRNLAYLSLVEVLHGYPLDGVAPAMRAATASVALSP